MLDFTYITVKKNGEILEKVLEQYVLVEYRFVKIVLEVTDGMYFKISSATGIPFLGYQ